jgi:hypothetical protein
MMLAGRQPCKTVSGDANAAHPLGSALGHEQTSRHVRVMSVITLKADIHQRELHVR